MFGSKRGRISIFGKFIYGDGDFISAFGKTATQDSIGIDANFNFLIKDIQDLYVEPFYNENYIALDLNLYREVREIVDSSIYIRNANLSSTEKAALRYDDTISREPSYIFYSREIAKFLELYKDSDEYAYNLLNDCLNIINRGNMLVKTLQTANDTIVAKDRQLNFNNSRRYGISTLETSIDVSLQFDITYLLYIQRYGNPVGGVFDAGLLGQISREIQPEYVITNDVIEPINPV